MNTGFREIPTGQFKAPASSHRVSPVDLQPPYPIVPCYSRSRRFAAHLLKMTDFRLEQQLNYGPGEVQLINRRDLFQLTVGNCTWLFTIRERPRSS